MHAVIQWCYRTTDHTAFTTFLSDKVAVFAQHATLIFSEIIGNMPQIFTDPYVYVMHAIMQILV
jgi:hypothetical protein